MKKIFLLFSALFLLSACAFNEQFYMLDNDRIRYEYGLDFSDFWQMGGAGSDSLRQAKMGEGRYPIDTIMLFADFAESNIIEADSKEPLMKEVPAHLKDLNVHVILNDTIARMIFSTKDLPVNQFNKFLQGLAKQSTVSTPGEEGESYQDAAALAMSQSYQVKFNGRQFERIALELTPAQRQMRDSLVEGMGSLMQAGMMTFKSVYHFPKPIKSTNAEDASFSLDRKTMTIENTFSKYLQGNGTAGFTVELED